MNPIIPPNRDRFHHTDAQMDFLNESYRDVMRLYQELMMKARAARDAYVKPGTPSEDGDVVRHGANNHLRNIEETFLYSAQQLKNAGLIDSDYFSLINYRVRYAGTRFHDEESFKREYDHLIEYIPQLEAKIGLCGKKIRLKKQFSTLPKGRVYTVIEEVPHGGYTDERMQYVVKVERDGMSWVHYIPESYAEVIG